MAQQNGSHTVWVEIMRINQVEVATLLYLFTQKW
jgi:hypothetical protein